MPTKCLTCRHLSEPKTNRFEDRLCTSLEVMRVRSTRPLPVMQAREICDKESNGIFVHYTPKNPAAGAAFQSSPPGQEGWHRFGDGVVDTPNTAQPEQAKRAAA